MFQNFNLFTAYFKLSVGGRQGEQSQEITILKLRENEYERSIGGK